jgi:hypothetical protein
MAPTCRCLARTRIPDLDSRSYSSRVRPRVVKARSSPIPPVIGRTKLLKLERRHQHLADGMLARNERLAALSSPLAMSSVRKWASSASPWVFRFCFRRVEIPKLQHGHEFLD